MKLLNVHLHSSPLLTASTLPNTSSPTWLDWSIFIWMKLQWAKDLKWQLIRGVPHQSTLPPPVTKVYVYFGNLSGQKESLTSSLWEKERILNMFQPFMFLKHKSLMLSCAYKKVGRFSVATYIALTSQQIIRQRRLLISLPCCLECTHPYM